ncbi:hypothetical protein HPB51_020996 [Rhipicephalus microplus]|uniref:Uncharacterized protein n=1 Tax=Rhipicephalus microplus TaxID=6941 RepID=A0A9J6DCG2_RHIMP|nr:hypothetical protein HPB51_020996 [Rhipicephalus microplus]
MSTTESETADVPCDTTEDASKRGKSDSTKRRAQRATSNVFAMFEQNQIAEFKEVGAEFPALQIWRPLRGSSPSRLRRRESCCGCQTACSPVGRGPTTGCGFWVPPVSGSAFTANSARRQWRSGARLRQPALALVSPRMPAVISLPEITGQAKRALSTARTRWSL